MTYEQINGAGLDYMTCRYHGSRLMFRGPPAALDKPYIALVGGSDVYGRFCETTLGEALAAMTGHAVVNLGQINAGLDAFWHDTGVQAVCQNARLTIIQAMGAQNMSNRLYRVHPRRNDRLTGPSNFLRTLYPEIDFTQFHFTRHLLSALQRTNPDRFSIVAEELGMAWRARMQQFLDRTDGETIFLWMSDAPPLETGKLDALGHDPMFVARSDLDAIRDHFSDFLEVVARPDEIAEGRARMVFEEHEEPVAQEMLGPIVHERAARELAQLVSALV